MNKSQKRAKAVERKAEKHKSEEYKEHLTNWYMINLSWGILGIILTVFYGSLYKGSLLLYMNTISWVLTGIFAVVGIALFVLGKIGKIKNQSRACHYGIFMWVCAAVALWFALFNKLRMIIESAARAITGNQALAVTSYWNYRLPIIAIAVYLVVAFIVYLIKLGRK